MAGVAAPATAIHSGERRPSFDQSILEDDFSLASSRLLEPGWVDPEYVAVVSRMCQVHVPHSLKSILVMNRKFRSRSHIPTKSIRFSFHGVTSERDVFVSFCTDRELFTFEVEDFNGKPWRKVRQYPADPEYIDFVEE